MPIIRLLHLSDLRGCGAPAPCAAVGDAPWARLLDEIAEVGLVDMLCLTGDSSDSGQREEFSALTPFIERSRTRLGIARDRIFAVPGNRDVDRRLAAKPASRLRALARRAPAAVSAWSAGRGPAPEGIDAACLRAVFQRQQAFWGWVVEELQQPERREVDALGYHAEVPITGASGQVHVFGLNSAWSCSGRVLDEDPPLLGDAQVASLVHDIRGAAYSGLRLALLHHPPASLADGAACASLLTGAVDLVLCGHGPQPRFVALAGGTRLLAGGPLADDAGEPPSCQLIQVETDTTGRPLGYAAHIWTWSAAHGRWHRDAPGLREARRGRLYWSGSATLPRGPASSAGTLSGLLVRLFASADELRRWLCMRLPDIYVDLPGGTASLNDLAFASQGLLERAGLIDEELLDALADYSPAYGSAVGEFSESLKQRVRVAPAASTPTTPARAAPNVELVLAEQTLQRQLGDAKRRRGNLQSRKLDAAAVDEEILELRRKLREAPAARHGAVLADGRYLLHGVLGRGGFATVWRAHDRLADLEVALKILHPQEAQDPARRERFFRGARAMQRLAHPAVVRVLDPHAGELPQPFFVMEIVEGRNLHEAVTGGPRVELHEVVAIACTIGEALAEAHAQGMVHRDIKPANIVLDRGGAPHLTDFDLVRARDTTGGTRTGGMGTVIYAAPELVQNADDADARADIYGLGMTVLFMLFGHDLPYKDVIRNPEVVLAHVSCPAAIKRVVLRAIAWDREQRFADVTSFCAALGRAHDSSIPRRTLPVPVLTRSEGAASPRYRSHEIWTLAGLAAAVLGSSLYFNPVQAPERAASSGDAVAAGPPAPESVPPRIAVTTGPSEASDDGTTSSGEVPKEVSPPPADTSRMHMRGARPARVVVAPADVAASTPSRPQTPVEPTAPAPPVPSAEDIRDALRIEARTAAQGIRATCHQAGAEDETPTLVLTIDPSGEVADAQIDASARGTALGDCIEVAMRRVRFTGFSAPRQVISVAFDF